MSKKTYSKPDIFFEDFSLSTNIAAGCEEEPFNNTEMCGVKWGKSIIFTSAITGCNKKIIEGSTDYVDYENNPLCYHNPTEEYNVFFS